MLMLSIQAVRGLTRLRASGVVHCIISFSGNSLVCSWCDHSMLASCFDGVKQFPVYSSLLHSFVFFAVYEIGRIFVSLFISKASRFHIFCSDALIACPLFNLDRNSVVNSTIHHLLSSGIKGTGTYPPAADVHSV